MARPARPLTEITIRAAIRAAEGTGKAARAFPLWDGNGLHLINREGASRYHWRLKYARPDGRENRLALGHYPEVSLAEARKRAMDARYQLRDGIDPGLARKERKAAATETFAKYAKQWLKIHSPGWAKSTRQKQERIVNHYMIPKLGARLVRELSSRDVLPVIRDMAKHAPVLARKAGATAQAIIRHAISEGARDDGRLLDLDLRGNLPKYKKGHLAAATTRTDVKLVIGTIRALKGEITRAALFMCAYTAQRPGDVAAMRWADVDKKTAEWIIPKTKTGAAQVVPLSRQALALVESMEAYSAGDAYVFPAIAKQRTPHLHRDSLSKALRDAGLRGKQTPHGLRATLRTLARERLGVSSDVLEAQLAHAKRGDVQAAYDRTGFVAERHRVMQAWADYLDAIK